MSVPKRISALNNMSCPSLAALRTLDTERTHSMKANSGSAVGRVIQLWIEGSFVEEALLTAKREGEAYPKADWDLVAKWARAYVADARNHPGGRHGETDPAKCEAEVKLNIGCHPFVGHIDQVRRLDGRLWVWDLKSGAGQGVDMVSDYAWQQAAYAVACTETWGEEVGFGGIIRLRGYFPRAKVEPSEASVFFEAYWDTAKCRQVLSDPQFLLDMLGRGEYLQLPGRHCRWCPAPSYPHCGDHIEECFAS